MIPLEIVSVGSKHYVCEERLARAQRLKKILYTVEIVNDQFIPYANGPMTIEDPVTQELVHGNYEHHLQMKYPEGTQLEMFPLMCFDTESAAKEYVKSVMLH